PHDELQPAVLLDELQAVTEEAGGEELAVGLALHHLLERHAVALGHVLASRVLRGHLPRYTLPEARPHLPPLVFPPLADPHRTTGLIRVRFRVTRTAGMSLPPVRPGDTAARREELVDDGPAPSPRRQGILMSLPPRVVALDAALTARASAGDQVAFRQIYDRH